MSIMTIIEVLGMDKGTLKKKKRCHHAWGIIPVT